MKQYTDFFKRLFSMMLYAAVILVLVITFFAGFLIFCYVLVALIIVGLIYRAYLSFKIKRTGTESSSFESGNVQSGDFKQSKGRIIEHDDKNDE